MAAWPPTVVAERGKMADLKDGLGARQGVLRLGVALDALERVGEHRDEQVDEHKADDQVDCEEEVRKLDEVVLLEDGPVRLSKER